MIDPGPAASASADWPPTQPAAQEHRLDIRFTGSGSEYFRIWIVNLLLTLLTLSLYHPWAKVRRLRYFYGNTLVGGQPLGFHADPRKMLRGYLLVALMLVLYSVAGRFSPLAGLLAFVIVAAIWPALLKASLQFRLANTSWRGLRLRFRGTVQGAYAALLPFFARWVLASLVATALLLGAAYHWGVPAAAQAALALIPTGVDRAVGETALRSLDEQWLQPSKLREDEQRRTRSAFARALAAQPAGSVPAYRVVFRGSRLGANAFALPDGTIVLTDELFTLVGGDAATLTGVLAHELGHVRRRHGLRLVLQAGAVGVLAGAVFDDFSSLLAGAPVLLGQAAYSRAAEREADAEALRVLRDAGLSPAVMVGFFEKIAKAHRTGDRLGLAIASHPADAERIRFFRDAAAQRRSEVNIR